MDLACATQLQLLATLVVGAVNYLLAVLPVPRATADKADRRIMEEGHRILGMPRSSLQLAVALEIPGMPF
jgi:hypothetical protein